MVELLVWNRMFFLKKWFKRIKYKRFHIIEIHDHPIRDNLGMLAVIRIPQLEFFHARKWEKRRILPRKLPSHIRKQLKMGGVAEVRDRKIIERALKE